MAYAGTSGFLAKVVQHLVGAVVAGQTRHRSAGMAAGAAEVEPGHRGTEAAEAAGGAERAHAVDHPVHMRLRGRADLGAHLGVREARAAELEVREAAVEVAGPRDGIGF